MPIDDLAAAVTRIDASGSWPDLSDAAHEAVTCLGGAGSSLGILEHGVVRQSARGFDARLDARYASIPVGEALPGPVAVRTRAPQLLEDRAVTLERYPATGPILADGEFEAAAVLPLLVGREAVGYLAAHYRGPRRFDQVELLVLGVVAAACAGAVARLRDGQTSTLSPEVAVQRLHAADDEIRTLRVAMASRAPIEQAKGILMQRYGLGPDAAWDVLRRLSNVLNTKVRDLAAALIAGDAVEGLSERFVSETPRIIGGQEA
jgi:GAF domain-containing protein